MVPSFTGMKTQRLTFRRVVAGIFVLALVGYLGAIVWLIVNETRLVFRADVPFDARRPALPYEDVEEHAMDGNDANLASRMNVLHYERLRALGVNVLAPEYRGFGGLPGVPTEPGLAQDAAHWYEYLRTSRHVAPEHIVIYGWSLGSAVAVTLASHVDEAAVILEGAPASIVAIGQQRYPIFPVRMLIHSPFESIQRVGAIHAPKLFLHSPEDAVVPIAEGRRLFDAAVAPKQFVEVEGGHVYASEKDPRFFPAIGAFLRLQHLLP